ncbi:MAG: hypothetical protein J6C97_00830 [Clostridia bacterium]|nr:hypothetical protein [Clostridia bacterium]
MKARVFKTISIICLLLVTVFSFALAINKNDKTYAVSTLIYQVDFSDSNDYGKNVASNLQSASFVNNGGVSFVKDSFLNKTAVQLTSTGVRQNYIKLPSDIFNGKTSVTISYHLKVSSTLPAYSRELEYGNGTNRMVYMPFHLADYFGYRIEKNLVDYAFAGTDTSVESKTEGEINLPNVGTILPLYNGWVLRSYVLTNTYFAVYQNGTEILRKEGDFTASQFYGASGYVYLGATDMDETEDFSGSFADIRVYDGILTPKEVEKQYGTTYKNYITDKWDFENENANNSIREYNGTLVGNATVKKVDGKGVLSLDGSNPGGLSTTRTSMTVHPGFIFGHREMTVSVNLKISSDISSYARIFEFAVDKTTYMALYAGFGEKANVRFEFTKDANSTREILTKADYTLPLDEWINVTLTLGLDKSALYIDGLPVAIVEDFRYNDGIFWARQYDNLTSWEGRGIMSFGKTSYYNDNPIIADYDCIEIYSKALTEQEILDSLGKIEYVENVDEYNEKYVDFVKTTHETYQTHENVFDITPNQIVVSSTESMVETKYLITEKQVYDNFYASVDISPKVSGETIDAGIYFYATTNPSLDSNDLDGINAYCLNLKRVAETTTTYVSLYRFDYGYDLVSETEIDIDTSINTLNLTIRVYDQSVFVYVNGEYVYMAEIDANKCNGGYIGLRTIDNDIVFNNMLIKANEFDINYSYLEDALSDTPLDKSLYTQASWEEYYVVYNLTNNVYQNKTATSQTNVKELANEYLLAKAKLDLKSSHNFNVSWSYDEYEHWHNCDDADCDVYDEKISHIYDNALDNECNDCGYIREIVINNSASLTLTGDIGVNLYIDVLKYTNDSNAYVELTYNHNSVGYKQQILTDRIDIKDLTHEDDYTYKFTVNYASGQINDKIFLTLFDGNGVELYATKDYYPNGYSIKEYCDGIINDESQPQNLRNLCQSIINYGVRAIDYFGYDASLENPTSSYIETIDGAPTEISSVPQISITEGAKYLTVNRFSLVALSETSIRVYFNTSGFVFDSTYTVECSRDFKTGYNDYGYYVEVYGIESTKIDELFTITIYYNGDEENKTIITYSAINYLAEKVEEANSVAESSEDYVRAMQLKELCLAINQYNYCAKAYFSS